MRRPDDWLNPDVRWGSCVTSIAMSTVMRNCTRDGPVDPLQFRGILELQVRA
jgi:hypothetical protein